MLELGSSDLLPKDVACEAGAPMPNRPNQAGNQVGGKLPVKIIVQVTIFLGGSHGTVHS